MNDKVFDSEFFQKLNTLQWNLNMHISQGMSGARKSNAKGSSVEFSDYREYIPGDDIRRIDWNAYGRTDKLYIKQFREEREGIFHIFVDTSGSMAFGASHKSHMALQIAAALSYIVLNNLDRVCVCQLGDHSIRIGKGIVGKAAFPYVLEELSASSFQGRTTLSTAIQKCPLSIGGVSFIISDFLDAAGIEDAIRYLAYRKQTICLVQVLAREELEVQYEGTLNLKDIESGEKVKITLSNVAIFKYQERLRNFRKELEKMARHYGAVYICVPADASLTEVMLQSFSGVLTGK